MTSFTSLLGSINVPLVESGVWVVTGYRIKEVQQLWDTHQEHDYQHRELWPGMD